jgi:hypothetical protein
LLKTTSRLVFVAGLVLLLGGALLLQTRYLLWGEWSFDQGHNLLIARLLDYGYEPYTEIFLDRPPLFFWSIGPTWTFFQSVEGLQLVMVAYSILCLAALVSIGLSLEGRFTGLLAGALLAFNFRYFVPSGKVMSELPAMSLALVGLALALRYQASGQRRWLVTSAIAMGGSLLVNYFMPWVALLILLILAAPPKGAAAPGLWSEFQLRRRYIVNDWLLWLLILLVVAFGSWFVYDVKSVLYQAVLFHLNKSEASEYNLAENFRQIWETFASQPVMSLCIVVGLAAMWSRFKNYGWLPILWFELTLGLAFVYSPLRSKHLLMFSPVMALLATLGLNYLLVLWRTHKLTNIRWGSLAGSLLLLALLAAELFRPYEALAEPRRDMVSEGLRPILPVLERFTTPGDCLITDHPYLAFVANRLPPPWLANLSYARFESGSLNQETLIDITLSYNCPVVAPVLDRLKNSNRPYYDWAKANYMRVLVVDGKEVMLGKPLRDVQPAIPLGVSFAGQVQLVGADWQPDPRGGYLSLYWKTLRRFSQNYKIFVQLRDQNGQTVASADHEAYDGLIPTQLWWVDAIIKDTNRLDRPADLQPGVYALYIGLYDPATLERLPIQADASGENAVIIPGLRVE